MQFFSPIELTESASLEGAAAAIVESYDDDVSLEATLEILKNGQVVVPAQFVLEIAGVLASHGILMTGPLSTAVAIPGQALETALPKDHRTTSVISRLLGEEEGDVPTSAVYDMVDLLTSIDEPEDKEQIALIGEVLARAILGVIAGIPDGIQEQAGLTQFRNSYNERLSALIDPDAEAAPEETEE